MERIDYSKSFIDFSDFLDGEAWTDDSTIWKEAAPITFDKLIHLFHYRPYGEHLILMTKSNTGVQGSITLSVINTDILVDAGFYYLGTNTYKTFRFGLDDSLNYFLVTIFNLEKDLNTPESTVNHPPDWMKPF